MVADTLNNVVLFDGFTWKRQWRRRPSLSDCLPDSAPKNVLFTAFKPLFKATVSEDK